MFTGKKRKQYSAKFKAKVAIEAIQGMKTVPELATQYEIHPTMGDGWKRQLLEDASSLFESAQSKENKKPETQAQIDELYRQIGQLKVERDFLAKQLSRLGLGERKAIIDATHDQLSIVCQCQLLGINRSTLYYPPVKLSKENLTGSSHLIERINHLDKVTSINRLLLLSKRLEPLKPPSLFYRIRINRGSLKEIKASNLPYFIHNLF